MKPVPAISLRSRFLCLPRPKLLDLDEMLSRDETVPVHRSYL